MSECGNCGSVYCFNLECLEPDFEEKEEIEFKNEDLKGGNNDN